MENFQRRFSPNDIHFVFKWWCQHIKKYYRDKHNLTGKFGTSSIELDDTGDTVKGFSNVPFIVPSVILYKKNNYDIYNSDRHEISIDGEPLSKSIVLSVKFDADAQNLDEILDQFKIEFYGAQAFWYLDKLESRVYPGFDLVSTKSTMDSAIKTSKQSDRLLTAYQSIAKILVGLICYDAYTQQTGEKISLDDVAEDIRKKISTIKPHTFATITQYYNYVRKKNRKY